MTKRGKNQKKERFEVKTFSVPFALGETKENISISSNPPNKPSKEQIIKQAIQLHIKGNISEAAKYYQLFLIKVKLMNSFFQLWGNLSTIRSTRTIN